MKIKLWLKEVKEPKNNNSIGKGGVYLTWKEKLLNYDCIVRVDKYYSIPQSLTRKEICGSTI